MYKKEYSDFKHGLWTTAQSAITHELWDELDGLLL